MTKRLLLPLLVLLLAWGVWEVLGPGEAPPGPGLGDGGLLDTTDPGGDAAARGVGGDPAGRMVGVDGEPGTRPDAAGTGPSEAQPSIVIHGRVVGVGRQPVAEAEIELRSAGQRVGGARTDAEGRYTLATRAGAGGSSRRGTLLARHEAHAAGTADVWLVERGTLAAPVIVLEPAHTLRVRVEVDGEPSPFATVGVALRNGGRVIPMGGGPVDPQGVAAVPGLAAGLYEVYAALPGRGRSMTRVRLPQAGEELPVIALGGERILDVLVQDARTGDVVPGATVHVGDKQTLPPPTGPGYLPARPPATTDGRGRATLRGLGLEETLYVNVEAAGYVPSVWWRASAQIAKPGESEVRVRLFPPRRVTFPIYAGADAPPEDGTPLRVEFAGRATENTPGVQAHVDGEYVQLLGLAPGPASGTFIAPDGRQARFTAPAATEMGNAVEFRGSRDVRVRVTEPGGAPVPDLLLRLNPLDGGARVEPARTDADGVAVFEHVAAERAGVHLRQGDAPWGGPLLGRIDLRDGQEEFAFTLEPRISFVLRVRIGTERALPSRFQVVAAGQRVPTTDIVEDPAAAALQVSLRAPAQDGSFDVQLLAAGYLPGTVRVDASDAPDTEHEVVLEPGGRVVVRATPPEDGRYALALQRYDPERGRWVPSMGAAGPGSPPTGAADGLHVYEGLADGRYRVVESRSGYESRPVDVVAGGPTIELAVDLSSAVEVRGRVEGPPGTALADARVRAVGRHAMDQPATGVRVDPDGGFVLRALKGERLELVVEHPVLATAARGGRATVTAGGAPVTLRLEPGPECSFVVTGMEQVTTAVGGAWHGPVQVKLYRGSLGGELVRAVQPMAQDGRFVFGGFAPGTYALWIGLGPQHAPEVRTGVALGTGRTDLGTITPGPGSTLVVELPGEGPVRSAVWVSVTSRDEPTYSRHASARDETGHLRVAGLGAGRFDVVVRASGAGGARVLYEAPITLDGSGETRIVVPDR